jgi:hypothetical protein
MRRSWILLVIFLFVISSAQAANHYIRAGATGTGTGADWANAWPSFSSVTKVRGDTYYVASGAYSESVSWTPAASGSTWSYVKKATVADHGTSTGWNDSYASGQAVITGKLSLGAYVSWDGVTGEENSGHGFKVIEPNCTVNSATTSAYASNVDFQHTEIQGCGIRSGYIHDGFYSVLGSPITNQHIAYIYMHDIDRNGISMIGQIGGIVIEHIYMDRVSGVGDIHGQAIQLGPGPMGDITVRYNKFKDINGQSIISLLGSVPGTFQNVFMYGNIIWQTDWDVYRLACGLWISSTQTATNIYHYNNTYYHVWQPEPYSLNASQTGTYSRNNMYVNCNLSANIRTLYWNVYEYNYYYNNSGSFTPVGHVGQVNGTVDPFISAPSNFALNSRAESKNRGAALGSQFALDYAGVGRPQGGAWDIGAYEAASTTSLNAPSNLRVVN